MRGMLLRDDVRARRPRPARPAPPPPIDVPSCLRVLGLIPPVDPEVVKRKYRELAMANHPDRGGDTRGFIAVERAYREALSFAGGGRP